MRCCASRERRSAFPFFAFGDSDNLQVGDLVLALGDPFGVGQTVTQGIVSALARTQIDASDYQFFIQTDASINPGNSGGALVDLDGRLEGINTAIYSRSGGSVGIGFAIPVNMVKVVVESAKSGAKSVRRPWLGAKLQTVTPEIAESLGLARPTGALVASLSRRRPRPTEAGIKRGDVILSIDGQPIDDPDAFGFRFATHASAKALRSACGAAANDVTLPIKLRTAPETPPRDLSKIEGLNPLSGVTLENLSPAVDEELSLDASSGVVIADVDDGSTAGRAGFQKGDILVEVNGAKITSPHDAQRVLADKQGSGRS